MADRGSESSRIYQSRGLVYRVLDGNDEKIGVPIKASLIYSKPTLRNIEAKFENNDRERQKYKQRVMNAIDFAVFKKSKPSLQELIKALQKEKIQVVLRQNDNGIIYGITYVDHHTKCVFNGSHLGKQYSANGIQQRCNAEQLLNQKSDKLQLSSALDKAKEKSAHSIPHTTNQNDSSLLEFNTSSSKLLDDLLQPDENRNANEPFEQKKFKRKRKRKQQQSHN